MSRGITTYRLEIHLDESEAARALRADAGAGLTATPKTLPPKWFYDARGSALFEQITELPEYYPTRTERMLLRTHAAEIATLTGTQTLIELGSGSSDKTRILLDALTTAGTLQRYVPLDVSEAALRQALDALAVAYPALELHGAVGDFTRHLAALPRGDRRMVAFLGGTIGNLLPAERAAFLAAVRATLNPGEHLLLGAGLVTAPELLVAAYADAAGVTAEFNRNALRVLNRQLGADFPVQDFDHVAVWNADHEWIEMRLRADREMTVTLTALDLCVTFAVGEELRTEISAKFRAERLCAELSAAGLPVARAWADPEQRFIVLLCTALPHDKSACE